MSQPGPELPAFQLLTLVLSRAPHARPRGCADRCPGPSGRRHRSFGRCPPSPVSVPQPLSPEPEHTLLQSRGGRRQAVGVSPRAPGAHGWGQDGAGLLRGRPCRPPRLLGTAHRAGERPGLLPPPGRAPASLTHVCLCCLAGARSLRRTASSPPTRSTRTVCTPWTGPPPTPGSSPP